MTLTAKEKACLHPDAEGRPACLPEVCPYANGYYDRLKDALAACWTAAAVLTGPRWPRRPGSSRCAPLSWG